MNPSNQIEEPYVAVISFTDLDGVACAAVVKHRYPKAQVILMGYRQPLPTHKIFPGSKIFITDYSLSPQLFRQLHDMGHDLIWIDHHLNSDEHYKLDPATKDLTIKGLRQGDKSSALLTWEYIFPNTRAPKLLQWLNDYSMWKFALPETVDISYGLNYLRSLYPNDQNVVLWNNLFDDTSAVLRQLLINGKDLREMSELSHKLLIEDGAYETEFEGHKVLAVNGNFMSSLCFASMDTGIYDGTIRYFWQSTNGTLHYKATLCDVADRIDCADLAQRYGGNGKRGVAGWSGTTEVPFKQGKKEGKAEVYRDFYKPVMTLYAKSNLVREGLRKDWRMLVRNARVGELKGHSYQAVNTAVPAVEVFQDSNAVTTELAIAWCWANCGKYRYVIHPISSMLTLNDLQKELGGEIVGQALWLYSDERLIK